MPDPAFVPDPALSWSGRIGARWSALPGNVRGGIWFVIGAAFFSLMLALIKLAGAHLHITQILFFRQLVMALVSLPVILRGLPGTLSSARPALQLLRVGLAFGAMLLGFSAVIHLPLAEATTLGFTRTFFMTILAILLLGEVVRIRRWAALVVGFVGVFIILRPDTGALNPWALASIGSAAMVACVLIVVRKLSQIDQPVTILTYQAVGVGILMFLPMLWFWRTPTPVEWGLLALIGVISAIGQYINILALRASEASALAPLDFTRLVFATLLGWLLFAEWPEPRVWVGAVIIIGAAVYTLRREQLARRREEG